MNAPLRADALQPLLATAWLGRECQLVDEVDSTNTLAAKLAGDRAPHGLLIAAESQTQGRGRMERRWQSPAGLNLYFSIVLRPQWEVHSAPPLSLAAGVAIAEAVESLVGHEPELKWPNDVLLGGRKTAGILVEAAAQRQQLKHVVLGIGVNVNQTEFPDELSARATSLCLAAGQAFDRAEVLAALVNRLERWIDALAEGNGQAVIDRWTRFAPWLGSEVRVTQGETCVAGTALALEPGGALRLRDATGRVQFVHCGDASGVMNWTY